MRFKLTLEYDGGPFVGWQRQDNGPSVQAALEAAVERTAGAPAEVVGAGRTDAGVHALGQVAHVDLARDWAPLRLREALNFHLRPAPVAVLAVEAVPPDFHARFSATERRYRYRILNRRAPPVLDRERVWAIARPLDAEAMHRAAQRLVGRHDFSSFRAKLCQAASPVKTLGALAVARAGDEVVVTAAARSFLHHQVRNIVGTLVQVGLGRWPEFQVSAVLDARDRAVAGPTAPAAGLYLIGVGYPSGCRNDDLADGTVEEREPERDEP